MRTLLKDENVRLTPPRFLTLEEAITYIAGTASFLASGPTCPLALPFRGPRWVD
jgi:hypothetical protein